MKHIEICTKLIHETITYGTKRAVYFSFIGFEYYWYTTAFELATDNYSLINKLRFKCHSITRANLKY